MGELLGHRFRRWVKGEWIFQGPRKTATPFESPCAKHSTCKYLTLILYFLSATACPIFRNACLSRRVERNRHALFPRSMPEVEWKDLFIVYSCRLPFARDITVCGEFFPCLRSISYCIDPCDAAVSVLDRRGYLLNWPPVFLKAGES